MTANTIGAGGNPRDCQICKTELNLFTACSVTWTGNQDFLPDLSEINFLCPTCFAMLRATYNSYVESFNGEYNV